MFFKFLGDVSQWIRRDSRCDWTSGVPESDDASIPAAS